MEINEIINIIIVPVITGFSWFIKSLFTTIKKQVYIYDKKINTISLSLQKFELSINQISKQLDNIHEQGEINSQRLIDYQHYINNLKSNLKVVKSDNENIKSKLTALEIESIKIKGDISKIL